MNKPAYVAEYENLLNRLQKSETDQDRLMERMIGDNYEKVGGVQRAFLEAHGLKDGQTVIDVGCGSGRTANALKDMDALSYLGTDVLQELLDYARDKTGRADWRFERISALKIPAPDETADFVLFFSIFTHLTWEQSLVYLQEARRVLKPGGKVVFSFLNQDDPDHIGRFRPKWRRFLARMLGRDVRIEFTTDEQVRAWLHETALVERHRDLGETVGHHLVVAQKAPTTTGEG